MTDERLWSIQILRFVAAVLVMHIHAATVVWMLTGREILASSAGATVGRCGVDIFFVISGFIITRTGGGLTAGQFLRKRAGRILPLYFILATVYTLIDLAISHLGWRDLVATYFLWPATDQMKEPVIPVGWTLCFEALFYWTFALVIWQRNAIWIFGGVFLAAHLLRSPSTPVLQFIGNPIILEFVAGVGLAFLPKWRPGILGIPIGVTILILGAVLHWPPNGVDIDFLMGKDGWIRVADLGIPAFLIVWGTIQLSARESVFTYLGDASYALYLVHIPILTGVIVVLSHVGKLPADVIVMVAIATSIVIAWRIHELVERPIHYFLKARAFPNQPSAMPTTDSRAPQSSELY